MKGWSADSCGPYETSGILVAQISFEIKLWDSLRLQNLSQNFLQRCLEHWASGFDPTDIPAEISSNMPF